MSFGLVPWWWGCWQGGEHMVTCAVSQRDAELDLLGVGVVDDLGKLFASHDARTSNKPNMPASLA